MSVFEKGLLSILATDVFLVLVSIPLILRKVPRNVVYGYRTRATLGNDVVWYEANAHFGRGLVIASLVSALAVFFLVRSGGLGPSNFLAASVAALALPPLVAALATARYVRRLTRDGPSVRTPR